MTIQAAQDPNTQNLTVHQEQDIAVRLAHTVQTLRSRMRHARALRLLQQIAEARTELGRLRVDTIIALNEAHKRRPFRIHD